jgi:hypothetical protein
VSTNNYQTINYNAGTKSKGTYPQKNSQKNEKEFQSYKKGTEFFFNSFKILGPESQLPGPVSMKKQKSHLALVSMIYTLLES